MYGTTGQINKEKADFIVFVLIVNVTSLVIEYLLDEILYISSVCNVDVWNFQMRMFYQHSVCCSVDWS